MFAQNANDGNNMELWNTQVYSDGTDKGQVKFCRDCKEKRMLSLCVKIAFFEEDSIKSKYNLYSIRK